MSARLLIIAIRNMRRQFRRTVLTVATYAIAVFVYTALMAVPASMDRIAEEAGKNLLLIVTAYNAYKLPAKYCRSIEKMPHVQGCVPEIIWGAIYRDPRDLIITYGVTPERYKVTADSDHPISPDVLKKLASDRASVSVGSVLMREHNWKIGQPLTLRSPSDARLTLRFVPVLELPQNYLSRMFFFDRRLLDDAVKNLFGGDIQDLASFLVVRVDQARNMGLVINQIDEAFHNSESETETVTESDSIGNFVTAIGDARPIIYSLCVLVLLTILLIAANAMAMMVRDRIAEVAVMRALGFSRGHVAGLLLCEALLIGATGAVIGAALALWYFSQGLSLGALTGAFGYMEVRPETALSAIGVAVLVSIASAIVPIINAARIPPAIAIRKIV